MDANEDVPKSPPTSTVTLQSLSTDDPSKTVKLEGTDGTPATPKGPSRRQGLGSQGDTPSTEESNAATPDSGDLQNSDSGDDRDCDCVDTDTTHIPERERAFHGVQTEVRITSRGKVRNYVTFAANLFLNKGKTAMVLRGLGNVINKTVNLAEVLKRRVKGLYTVTYIGSVRITDIVEAKEGRPARQRTTLVSVISILLTTEKPDTSVAPIQEPLPDDQVQPLRKPASNKRNIRRKRFTKSTSEGRSVSVSPQGSGGQPRAQIRSGKKRQEEVQPVPPQPTMGVGTPTVEVHS